MENKIEDSSSSPYGKESGCDCQGGCGLQWCDREPESESMPVFGYKWLNNWNKYNNNTELTLLVRGLRPLHDGFSDKKHSKLYECNEFLKARVVLSPGSKVLKDWCFEPLMDYTDIGSFIRIGSVVYVVGSKFRSGYTIFNSLTPKFSNGKPIQCLKGMSWFDLDNTRRSSDQDQTWNRGASPELYDMYLRCAALDGNIYCLTSSFVNRSMVYYPGLDKWFKLDPKVLLPKSLSDCYVSPRLIPDPSRKRILVHLSGGTSGLSLSSIFAWYPQRDSDNWVRIKSRVIDRIWKKKPTLVDGSMLFFFVRKTREFFWVLDLEAKEWLKVEWNGHYGSHLRRHKAKSMFYMGDNQLCLCFSQAIRPPISGSLVFVAIIEFERSSDSVITFTHRFTKSFYTEHIRPVDFIPYHISSLF